MTRPHTITEDTAAIIYRVTRGGYTPNTQESQAIADWERQRWQNIAAMREDDRDWCAKLAAAYDAAASELRADGWQEHPHPNIWCAARGDLLFTKGDRSAILARDLGRTNWRPIPSALTPDRCLLWAYRDPAPVLQHKAPLPHV